MKLVIKQSNRKRAFTIIELLTVMSVIIILIGLLVPALNMVKRFAKDVTQKNQFHTIEVALETFNAEWDDYPPSSMLDDNGQFYCGAMKLCEAMVGQDLLGFHPDSRFLMVDGAYDNKNDLSYRRLYLESERANVHKIKHVYGAGMTSPFNGENFILCDVYTHHVTLKPDPEDPLDKTSGMSGMPILYYKANTSNTRHNAEYPLDPENIYGLIDNQALVGLGMPWDPPAAPGGEPRHPLFEDPRIFYEKTRNDKIDLDGDRVGDRPYRANSYILLSAGWDGEYGTGDDIFNFER